MILKLYFTQCNIGIHCSLYLAFTGKMLWNDKLSIYTSWKIKKFTFTKKIEVYLNNLFVYCYLIAGSYGFTRDTLPKDEFIVTTSRSHSDRLVTETVEACEPTSVVRVGGAGHKVSYHWMFSNQVTASNKFIFVEYGEIPLVVNWKLTMRCKLSILEIDNEV